MSLLADYDVHRAQKAGELELTPWNLANLGPASYDVTLAAPFRRFRSGLGGIDLADVPEGHTELVTEQRDQDGRACIVLAPGDFILATTEEVLRLGANLAARVEGRSSLGRLGIVVHATAGFIDPGFCGQVTLEICNLSPVQMTLRPGMRVAQLGFYRMSRTTHQQYGAAGHYQGQLGPTESRFSLEPAQGGKLRWLD